MSNSTVPRAHPASEDHPTVTIPPRLRPHVPAKFESRKTVIKTLVTKVRTKSEDHSEVGETSFDITSFYPTSASGTSDKPPTTATGENPPTSTTAKTPHETTTSAPAPSNKLSTILPIVLAVVAVIAIAIIAGVYVARRRKKKKRNAEQALESARPAPRKASDEFTEQPDSPGMRKAYVTRQPSSRFFNPSSQVSLEPVRRQGKGGLYFPATLIQRENADFHPAIPMTDYPAGTRRSTDITDEGPSSTYIGSGYGPDARRPSPQPTARGYDSILSYYQNSGRRTNTGDYEQVPGSPMRDGFENVTTYGGGNMQGPPMMPTQRGAQPSNPYSDTASISTLNSNMRMLEARFGPAVGRRMGSAGRSTVAADPTESAFRARQKALAMLEGSDKGKRPEVVEGGRKATSHYGETVGPYESVRGDPEEDEWVDGSVANMSVYGRLQPDPLVIRKGGASPLLSERPYQRTGYEEYMENPYGVGQNALTEETPPLHIEGSYQNWVRAQREEHLERSADLRYNNSPAGASAINHSRGEGSGSQPPPRPPRPPTGLDDGEYGSDIAARNWDADRSASPQWYQVVRDRLQTRSPETTRLSEVQMGPFSGKGKGIVGRGAHEGYPYAGTHVNEEGPQAAENEGLVANPLGKKTSGRWKRVSGMFRKRER